MHWCQYDAFTLAISCAQLLSCCEQQLNLNKTLHTELLASVRQHPVDALRDGFLFVFLTVLLIMQENENILVSSCGDGSIKVWDVAAPPQANPLRHFQEHTREVRFPCDLCLIKLASQSSSLAAHLLDTETR